MDFGSDLKRHSAQAAGANHAGGMRYVSASNYFQVIERLAKASTEKPDLTEAIAGLSRFSLRDLFNNREIAALYEQRSALVAVRRWSKVEAKFDGDEIRRLLKRHERYFVRQYVLKVNTPRHHIRDACRFLKASFENFETPPEIEALGDDKVRKFQEFCDAEWPKYRDKPEDIFWAHVRAHFNGIRINPKKISYTSRDTVKALQSAEELELAIYARAEELRRHVKSADLGSYVFAPPRAIYARATDQNVVAERRTVYADLLELKKAIKILVFNLYRVELEMPEGLLPGELLEAFGFLPCRACSGDASSVAPPPGRIRWTE